MKNAAFSLILLAAMVAPMAFAGTSRAEDPINKKCPIKGSEVAAGRTVEYKKQLIGFCCADCVAKFEGEPEKWIKRVKEFKKTGVN